jgi:hypothetical protein
MHNLSAENRLLLYLSRVNLSIKDYSAINNILPTVKDWEFFYKCAINHGIGSLISKHFSKIEQVDLIPLWLVSKLNQIYFRSLSRNIILYEQFQKIQQVFSSNHIDVVPLKGIFLAETIYHDIGLRQMSDIDLLVKQEFTENCLQILMKMGYIATGRNKTEFIKNIGVEKHLPTMELNGILVEIHFRVFIDDSNQAIDINNYWENVKPGILFNTPTRTLSTEDMFQYLCIHLERHFNEGKIQLYQFADLSGILEKHEKDFNWDIFELSCEKNHCSKNVFRILSILQTFFLVSFPEKIQKKLLQYNNNGTENLFISFLKCNEKEISAKIENQNVKNLRKLKGAKNKFLYLIGDIFPSTSFMYSRYHINYKPKIALFYLLRMIKGASLLIRHISRKF